MQPSMPQEVAPPRWVSAPKKKAHQWWQNVGCITNDGTGSINTDPSP